MNAFKIAISAAVLVAIWMAITGLALTFIDGMAGLAVAGLWTVFWFAFVISYVLTKDEDLEK